MNPITDREIVESYIPIAKFIAAMSGPRCEVAVHYLADLDHSIIAIENGHLTGRKVGDTLFDFDLHTLFKPEYIQRPYLVNYAGKSSIGNRVFRFSTYYIRNAKGQLIGLLNTNVDVTDMLELRRIASRELFMSQDSSLPITDALPQALATSTTSLIKNTLAEAMEHYGYTDPQKLKKEEKLRIISYLHARSIFALKGAVSAVAKKLCISEPTAYRYLRSQKDAVSDKIPLQSESTSNE